MESLRVATGVDIMIEHGGCRISSWPQALNRAAICGGAFLLAVPVHATPSSGFVPAPEWQGPFEDLNFKTKTDNLDLKLQVKGDMTLVATRINIAPGGTSGWHTHPGSSLVTVTQGQITLYDATLCTPKRLGVGETFVDEGGDHVHLVRNETDSSAAVGVVQMVERGAPGREDAPRPTNCAANVQ